MSFSDLLADATLRLAQKIGVTRQRTVRLGTPGGQVVPTPGTAPAGRLWVHDPDTNEVFLAQNTDAGLSYDDTSAGVLVDIAYRPGEDMYSIIGVNPVRGLQDTGGALPSQIAQVQASVVDAAKIVNFSLRANGTMVLGCMGGLAAFGGRIVELSDSNSFADLTSYVPGSVNTGVIVAVGWNGTTAVVVSGATYDSTVTYTTAEYLALHPRVIGDGVLMMGYVYLVAGMTGIERAQIRPVPHMFTVAPSPFRTPPATATSPGVVGQIAYDDNYLYVCVQTDTWRRVGISTW